MGYKKEDIYFLFRLAKKASKLAQIAQWQKEMNNINKLRFFLTMFNNTDFSNKNFCI